LSILGNLLSRSSGDVVFANGHGRHGRPERGDIGIVPQKNVLFDDLTCLQNLRVWRAVKRPVTANGPGEEQEDLEQLLRDCDLGKKIHERASTLSGGQKRKLQLAAGLVGGSSSEFRYIRGLKDPSC
jgi:ATP-binding cassette subfamily A (ABC1) protein 3